MILRTITLLILALSFVSAQAHGPSRQKVTQEIKINAPAAKVWGIIADFCAISVWHPAIAKCAIEGANGVGAQRTLRVGKVDGPQILEELQTYDAPGMMYRYRILKTDNSVLPVSTYSSFLSVKDNGDNTATVEWRSGFYRAYAKGNPPPELNDEAAVKAVTDVYALGLANLKKLAEK